jgi:hypothetical protein
MEYRKSQPEPIDTALAEVKAICQRSRCPATTLFLPEAAFHRYQIELPAATWQRIATRAKSQLHDPAGVLEFMSQRGLDGPGTKALINAFNEDEQAKAVRFAAVVAALRPRGGEALEVWFYSVDDGMEKRNPVPDFGVGEAVQRFLNVSEPVRAHALLLADRPLPIPAAASWSGGGWFIYERHGKVTQ